MVVPCRATGYVRRPPGCPPSSHGARCKPRAAWATCATPCATTAARPRSHAHSGAHGGSRRVPRSRAGAPRGHLAHARQRQPRGHRARRLRPEGEAARTIIRRAGAAHAAAGAGALQGDHNGRGGRHAPCCARPARGARATRGPRGARRTCCAAARASGTRLAARFMSKRPPTLESTIGVFLVALGALCVAARAAVRAPWCFQGASGAQTRARAAAGPCAARAARARGRRGYFTARRARFLRRARRPVRHENEMRNESCGLRDLRARARPAACLLLLRCALARRGVR